MAKEPELLRSPHEAAGAPFRNDSLPQLGQVTPNEVDGKKICLGDTGIELLPGCKALIADVVHNLPNFRIEKVYCERDCVGRIFASQNGRSNTGQMRAMLSESCRMKEQSRKAQPSASTQTLPPTS